VARFELRTKNVKTSKRNGLLAAMFAASLLVGGSAQAAETAAKTGDIGPTIKIFKGEKCVEPTADMRRNHMKYILHQRDRTMHLGIRTTKHSLKNCIDCHADPKTNSVLGKDGFCASCHQYAAVSIDCFSCHTPAPESSGQPPKAAATAPSALRHLMRLTAESMRPQGDKP